MAVWTCDVVGLVEEGVDANGWPVLSIVEEAVQINETNIIAYTAVRESAFRRKSPSLSILRWVSLNGSTR